MIHVSNYKNGIIKYKKDTENINPEVSSTNNGRIMVLSNVKYVEGKNQGLLKIKKQKDY